MGSGISDHSITRKVGGVSKIEPNYDKLGPLLADFGHTIADDVGEMPQRAYAFVSGGDRSAQYKVYVDEGDAVRVYFPDDLFGVIMDIWEAENGKREPALRWVYFNYDIEDGRFRVQFCYPEEIAAGTDEDDWQAAAVRERFGDKRVIEPDFPTEDDPPRS